MRGNARGGSPVTRSAPRGAVTVAVSMRFGDVDAYGHLNNVATFSLLEEARIKVLWRSLDPGSSERDHRSATHPDGLGKPVGHEPAEANRPTAVVDARPGGETAMLVAAQRIEYLKPITYRMKPLPIDLWIGKLGGATLQLNYLIRDLDDPNCLYVRAETLLVCADPATNAPRRLTVEERQAWTPMLGERMRFVDR